MVNCGHVNNTPGLQEVNDIPDSKLSPILVDRNCFGVGVLLDDKLNCFIHINNRLGVTGEVLGADDPSCSALRKVSSKQSIRDTRTFENSAQGSRAGLGMACWLAVTHPAEPKTDTAWVRRRNGQLKLTDPHESLLLLPPPSLSRLPSTILLASTAHTNTAQESILPCHLSRHARETVMTVIPRDIVTLPLSDCTSHPTSPLHKDSHASQWTVTPPERGAFHHGRASNPLVGEVTPPLGDSRTLLHRLEEEREPQEEEQQEQEEQEEKGLL
ncbi:hypothetical protein O3P69_015505 [Scylla paramamosain]|uniref:Uncharacterized protein n=1 Tax=Scylla paramamosain TaxID=85552 RepID=A0AAW0T589_SCYPA